MRLPNPSTSTVSPAPRSSRQPGTTALTSAALRAPWSGPAGIYGPTDAAEFTMQGTDLLSEFRCRPGHRDRRCHLLHRQRTHRRRIDAQLAEPADQLLRRRDVGDAAQPDPRVRSRAHGTVLTRGVHRRSSTLSHVKMLGGPTRQRELWMAGLITVRGAVAVLSPHDALGGHQHRPERLVAGRERLLGQLEAPAQVPQIVRAQRVAGHRLVSHEFDTTRGTSLRHYSGHEPSSPSNQDGAGWRPPTRPRPTTGDRVTMSGRRPEHW
jgi:hypothetical protein